MQRRSDELDEPTAVTLRLKVLKRAIVQELIAHRITLREEVACFRALNQEALVFPGGEFRQVCPGRTDHERPCREVIVPMKALRWKRPAEEVELVARARRPSRKSTWSKTLPCACRGPTLGGGHRPRARRAGPRPRLATKP